MFPPPLQGQPLPLRNSSFRRGPDIQRFSEPPGKADWRRATSRQEKENVGASVMGVPLASTRPFQLRNPLGHPQKAGA